LKTVTDHHRDMDRATLNLALGSANRAFSFRPGTSDEGVIDQIFKKGDYNLGRLRRSPELSAFYNKIAASSKSPLILDAGANIGASSIYFSYSFPKAQVVAIEPEPSNFDLLQTNTGGIPVECIQGALAANPGRVGVVDTGEGFWGYRTTGTDSNSTGQSVTCVTINELFESKSQSCVPFIVKIDIEGAESDLFSAHTEWVAATPLIIIELHDWLLPGKANSRAFLRCISGFDRDFVHIGENIFSIDNNLMADRLAA